MRDSPGQSVIPRVVNIAHELGPTIDELVQIARDAGEEKATRRTIYSGPTASSAGLAELHCGDQSCPWTGGMGPTEAAFFTNRLTKEVSEQEENDLADWPEPLTSPSV